MREIGYFTLALAFGDAGLEYRHEARGIANAQMGERRLRARVDHNYSEQNATAKDHRDQRACERGVELASREPLRRFLFMWPWGDPFGKVTVYDAFKKACSAPNINDFRSMTFGIPSLSSGHGGRGFGHGEGITRP
jgi:hypothetical protein